MRKHMLLALGGLLLMTRTAPAQNTDIESLAGITFNFANPGARSMGMGGAFLGLADDASAAEANPAGLTILRKLEISLEARHYRNVQELAISGFYPDQLITNEFDSFSSPAELQFASVVIPIGNFAIAAYYHQPLNYSNNIFAFEQQDRFGTITQTVPQFYLPRGNPPGSSPPVSLEECLQFALGECSLYAVLPFRSLVEIELETWGVAGAVKLGVLSIGASVRYHNFSEDAFTIRFFQGSLASIAGQATDFDLNSLETGVEHDSTFAAGFKWAVSDRFSVGGSYKQGPEFDAPVYIADFFENEPLQRAADTKFHLPDVAGLGISFRPISALTLNADAVFLNYSNLTDDFRSIGFGTVFQERPFVTDDVTEIHVGGEYFFPTKVPFAVRGGWWQDPAHSLRYAGPLTCDDPNYPEDQRVLCAANRVSEAILFPGGQDLDHYTIGVGLAWPSFQIDAAYDTSAGFKVGSISGVFRF